MKVVSSTVAQVDLLVLFVVVFEFGAQGEVRIIVFYVKPGVVLVSLLFTVIRGVVLLLHLIPLLVILLLENTHLLLVLVDCLLLQYQHVYQVLWSTPMLLLGDKGFHFALRAIARGIPVRINGPLIFSSDRFASA